jgi:outer membrane protein OmpA-like peptidoglycan-associated protein
MNQRDPEELEMKSHILLTLLLSTALAIPALAQQSSSSSSMQQAAPAPAMQSGDTTLEPLQAPVRRDFWDGDDPSLGSLLLHPFATKAYVKRYTQPIKDRLEELDELTSANSAKIKDVDSRAQHGIQLASDKASLADQHATDATNQAQTAQTSATNASGRVSSEEQVVANLDHYNSGAQTEILFGRGQTALSKQAKEALDSMAAPLKDQHSYIIEISGFAPGHGQAAILASQKMADSVVRYLIETHQIPTYRIYILGMGDAATADATTAKHATGRVEVSLLKNNLVSSSQH